jgi:HK97 family phage portal protein
MPEILIANSLGAVTSVRGPGDDMSGSFFHNFKINLGDSELKEPYKQHVWIHSCIDALATVFKSVPFLIVREDKKNNSGFKMKSALSDIRKTPLEQRYFLNRDALIKKGFDIVEDGPLYDIFHRPNPIMCGSQLWESYIVNKYLTGSSFFLLEGKKKYVEENEWPKEIWPASGSNIEPVVDGGMIKGWKRVVTSGHEPVDFHQAIWFYKFNPYDLSRGLSIYDVVKESAGQDYRAAKFNSAFLENGAEPGGILTVDKFLPPKDREALLNTFNDRHKGPSKTNKTALLQGGAKYDRNPNTHKDMQFLDGRKFNRDEIFGAFRVPKMLGSIYEDLQLATAKAAIRMFWENVAIPELHYVEDVLNSTLFDNAKIKESSGCYCMFDVSGVEALREDLELKSTIAKSLFDIGVPLNDINKRVGLGFPEYPWGNTWYKPFSLSPYDENGQEPPTEPPPAEDENKKVFSTSMVFGKGIDKATKSKVWDSWIQRVFVPVEKPFKTKLQTYWYNLRKDQMSRFNEATKSLQRELKNEDDLDALMFNNKDWQKELKNNCKKFIYQSGEFSIQQVIDEIGLVDWSVKDPRIVAMMENKINLISGITDRFWHSLRSSIADGMSQNETVAQLSTRIKGEFNNIASSSRTLTIARTETAQTASSVRDIIFKEEGVKKQDWSDANDENTRETHIIYGNAGPEPIGFNYCTLSGVAGTLLHPSYIGAPASEVINCRCLALPVL